MNLRRTVVVAGLAGTLAAASWWFSRPLPVTVQVHAVETGRVESSVANTRAGTVQACRRARLSLAVGGQIQELPIQEGDHVEAGQVLLELWNEDLGAQLLLAEQQRAAAGALAEEACARAEVARADAKRLRRLRSQNLISDGDMEKAEGEAKAQAAACGAAHSSVGVSDAQVKVARAVLKRTILRAPFAGTVAEINGERFEFVTPSPIGVATPPAVDLIEDQCIYVKAPIDEVDAPQIRAGQEARVSLDAFPEREFPARVRRVAPYVMDFERQSRTVDVEVDILEQGLDKTLLPGFSADVEILLNAVDNALRVPTAAVLEGPKVLLLDSEAGLIREREIKTGLRNWRWTEISSGLKAGELVITSVDRKGVVKGERAVADAGD